MREPKSPEQVLWNIFPLLLVAILLIGGIFILPKLNQTNLDDRSRASEPTKSPTSLPREAKGEVGPEIVCSDLYDPVCDPKTGQTYSNSCEASLAKATNTTKGECSKALPINLPTTN